MQILMHHMYILSFFSEQDKSSNNVEIKIVWLISHFVGTSLKLFPSKSKDPLSHVAQLTSLFQNVNMQLLESNHTYTSFIIKINNSQDF